MDPYSRDPYADDRSFEDPFAISETDELSDLPLVDVRPPPASLKGGASSTLSTGGANGSVEIGNIDLGAALRPGAGFNLGGRLGGSGAAKHDEKQYLAYERRGLWGQCGYNIGYAYFGGLALGGPYGMVNGIRNAPNRKFRILLNSVLNGSGRYGSRTGNAVGVLALLYTVIERQLEDVEVDRMPGRINNLLGRDLLPRDRWDLLIPTSAAFVTGAAFAVPRALAMKSVEKQFVTVGKRIGVMATFGMTTVMGVAVLATVGPSLFGDRSPFRFSS